MGGKWAGHSWAREKDRRVRREVYSRRRRVRSCGPRGLTDARTLDDG